MFIELHLTTTVTLGTPRVNHYKWLLGQAIISVRKSEENLAQSRKPETKALFVVAYCSLGKIRC